MFEAFAREIALVNSFSRNNALDFIIEIELAKFRNRVVYETSFVFRSMTREFRKPTRECIEKVAA